jgi:hypothetical protein
LYLLWSYGVARIGHGVSLLATQRAPQSGGRIGGGGFGQRALDLRLEIIHRFLLVGCQLDIGELTKAAERLLVFLLRDLGLGAVNEALSLLLSRFDLCGGLVSDLFGCRFGGIHDCGRVGGCSLVGFRSTRSGFLFLAPAYRRQSGARHDSRDN